MFLDIRSTEDQTASLPAETKISVPGPSQTSTQPAPNRNYKNLLQEYCQKNSHPVPEYKAEDVGDQHSHVSVYYYDIVAF